MEPPTNKHIQSIKRLKGGAVVRFVGPPTLFTTSWSHGTTGDGPCASCWFTIMFTRISFCWYIPLVASFFKQVEEPGVLLFAKDLDFLKEHHVPCHDVAVPPLISQRSRNWQVRTLGSTESQVSPAKRDHPNEKHP